MATGDSFAPRVVRCPACGGPSVYAPDQPFRPFCSARCRGQDFGAWASESYRVGGGDVDPADPDPDSGPDASPPDEPAGR